MYAFDEDVASQKKIHQGSIYGYVSIYKEEKKKFIQVQKVWDVGRKTMCMGGKNVKQLVKNIQL